MRQSIRVIWALTRRALNEILRVPGAAIPGVLAPTIFFIGLSGAFGKAAQLPGFHGDDFRTFIIPVSIPVRRPASTWRATSSTAGSTGCWCARRRG
ncbi:MAG: hypothetical protein E6G41_13355 [Actinobacteria bacterium]|nr:MAG: hypothetical protein E6G41_13355 [Actinomycetota bacterium]